MLAPEYSEVIYCQLCQNHGFRLELAVFTSSSERQSSSKTADRRWCTADRLLIPCSSRSTSKSLATIEEGTWFRTQISSSSSLSLAENTGCSSIAQSTSSPVTSL